jgi:hypothetical protein
MINRRSESYFHPRKYVGNNIEYRIGSSKALSKFKESQTFLLSQLLTNPFHKFSITAKELLLMQYDLLFDFYTELEQYFLVENGNSNIEDILELTSFRINYMRDTLIQVDKLDKEYLKKWLEMHVSMRTFIEENADIIMDDSLLIAGKFAYLVDIGIMIMNHTLYELEELDNLFYTKTTPIFIFDEISCRQKEEVCGIIEDIKIGLSIRDFKKVIIKNYVDGNISEHKEDIHRQLKEMNLDYEII